MRRCGCRRKRRRAPSTRCWSGRASGACCCDVGRRIGGPRGRCREESGAAAAGEGAAGKMLSRVSSSWADVRAVWDLQELVLRLHLHHTAVAVIWCCLSTNCRWGRRSCAGGWSARPCRPVLPPYAAGSHIVTLLQTAMPCKYYDRNRCDLHRLVLQGEEP